MLHIYIRICLASPTPLPHTCTITLCPLAKLGLHRHAQTNAQTHTCRQNSKKLNRTAKESSNAFACILSSHPVILRQRTTAELCLSLPGLLPYRLLSPPVSTNCVITVQKHLHKDKWCDHHDCHHHRL